MRRCLALAAGLCGGLVTVVISTDAGAGTVPSVEPCPDSRSAIRAAPGNPPGSAVETKGADGVDWIDARGGPDCIAAPAATTS